MAPTSSSACTPFNYVDFYRRLVLTEASDIYHYDNDIELIHSRPIIHCESKISQHVLDRTSASSPFSIQQVSWKRRTCYFSDIRWCGDACDCGYDCGILNIHFSLLQIYCRGCQQRNSRNACMHEHWWSYDLNLVVYFLIQGIHAIWWQLNKTILMQDWRFFKDSSIIDPICSKIMTSSV